MRVGLILNKPTNEVMLSILKTTILRDLAALGRTENVQPVVSDVAMFLLGSLRTFALGQSSSCPVLHITLRDLQDVAGIKRMFSPTVNSTMLENIDVAVLYKDGSEADQLIDNFGDMASEKGLTVVDRMIGLPERDSKILVDDSTPPKWVHAVNKAMYAVKRMPNRGLQTRIMVDIRPPRNPND